MEAKYVTWRQTYLRSAPEGLYCFYNAKGDNGDAITCSEAHGYAMLIAVLHGNEADFAGLVSFFLRFRNANGLMKWQVRSGAGGLYVGSGGETSATDGDVDIATALLLAGGRYRALGLAVVGAIYGAEVHPTLHVPLLGDWATRDSGRLWWTTRTSDFILSAFALFHHVTGDARWRAVLDATVGAALAVAAQSELGLLPDFIEYNPTQHVWRPAHGKLLESQHDGHVSWNACRTPWRLAHYYATTRDTRLRPLLAKMHSTYTRATTFPATPAGINMWNATPLVPYSDRAFIAPIGYLCYVMGDSDGHAACVKALNDQQPAYFGDSIDLVIAEQAIAADRWFH